MKKKLVSLSIAALALSSCSFTNFFSSIVSLEIYDFHETYYQGVSFKDDNELQIVATYTNGEEKLLSFNDVAVNLKNGGNTQSAYDPFVTSGTYDVTVSSGTAVSNTITIDVSDTANYATNIELNASSSVVDTMEMATFTVESDPLDYNLNYELTLSSETAYFEKIDKGTYLFVDSRPGVSTVTVKAKSGASSTITQSIDFTVTANYVEKTIAQKYKTLNTKNCPSKGEIKILVIPMWLTDSSSYISKDREVVRRDIETAYFGTKADTGWNSVSSFYEEESGGKVKISGIVSEWYESGKSVSDISTDDESGSKTFSLINTATAWYFDNHEDSRSNYDYDGDGFIDGVMVIYGAPDYFSYGVSEEYRKNKNLWAYYTYSDSLPANVTNPNIRSIFWASYDFMYGYKDALDKTGNVYYKGSTTYCRIDTHTYIHEMGHVFGLEDYYDYGQIYRPAGAFSMQDYNVGGHDPFSVMSLGWAKPFIPTKSGVIHIGTFQKTRELILLTPSWNSTDSAFDEYLLLELYSNEGLNEHDSLKPYTPYGAVYPQGPTNVGIRLWHVDARLTYNTFTTYSEDLFTDPTLHSKSMTAFSNTFIKESVTESHVTPLAKYDRNYALYSLLTLVRNNKNDTYKCDRVFSTSDMFYAGDSFNLQDYGKQFPYKEIKQTESYLLNKGVDLGWTFRVLSITNGFADIEVTKI